MVKGNAATCAPSSSSTGWVTALKKELCKHQYARFLQRGELVSERESVRERERERAKSVFLFVQPLEHKP